ncbi:MULTISPECIES: DNA polymerase III subunit alpha [unclassified Sporosarcina]|uniref:DNA polymerase III subunit alpha n=1 Tax=unclassified Sporosarcina TaxID=2647733 RepID=UPI00204007F0|nr:MULTISPECIES: DNA polymerase III subunit alpha [unclassified Sporosarcina]GKV66892.1 DNA polymerase III subunit alpha [Sporosarcina sp. NCCP-2331]GLB57187.1 DNA polymerase III subunit alpha [Sporosarcina sp. NCCP-2378]
MDLMYPQIITGADLLRGIVKLDELAPLLQKRGARSAAIVNSKLYGVRSFSKMLLKYGIQPVIGLSVYVTVEEKDLLVYVYAHNQQGFSNLMKMSSAISTREEENLPLAWLNAYRESCSIVCAVTDSSWADYRTDEVVRQIVGGGDTATAFIGIARPGGFRHPEEETLVQIAENCGLRVIACQETRFLHLEDFPAYEVAAAIRNGYKLNDPQKPPNRFRQAFLPEESELLEWFRDVPQWLHTMEELLRSCQVELSKGPFQMPVFPVGNAQTPASLLTEKCLHGLQKRFQPIPEEYMDRLHYEIDVIEEMGFTDYFLIVEDYVKFAKSQKILVGPGRGSSAGSLVAFSLGITEVDPIHYGLLFERFLNPQRVTMPDIDIDFADNRRTEVVNYVAETYGKQYTAQIITFGTLSTKAVARNVGRVLDFSPEEVRFISNALSRGLSFKDSVEQSKKLQDWIAVDPKRALWQQAAEKLEDLPRNASTHAAGVVLSAEPLVHFVPLQLGTEEVFLTQWAMEDVEEAGLLKMDFLGLRNLTLLDRIHSMIHYNKNQYIDFEKISFNDQPTYRLFKSGDTTGIFQFESPGMRQALRAIQPDDFKDLYSVNALYRPGPMEFIPLYSRRKKGQEPTNYEIPELQPILSDTYGIIIYQEQIMKIAVEIAGFSMAEADLLRRAISKKNQQVLEEERQHFIAGATKKGFNRDKANNVYNLIVKFADYGFPKSHAVAYTLISYRLAYFKANEPLYFYAAYLSSLTGSKEKMMELIREIQAKGIQIAPPSVQKSRYGHTVEGEVIRLGLGAIKGVTYTFYQQLAEARQKNHWNSMFDMAVAMGAGHFTEKALLPLIKAGALDEFGETRSVLLASFEAAHSHALYIGDDAFSDQFQFNSRPKYTPGGKMDRMTMLRFERDTLGFYLSEHPVQQLKQQSAAEIQSIDSAVTMRAGAKVNCMGMILSVKRIRTKKGEAMAFFTLQDETGEISCTVFPKQYAETSIHLTENHFIQVAGSIDYRNQSVQLIAERCIPLSADQKE